jgi:hypothetical protein
LIQHSHTALSSCRRLALRLRRLTCREPRAARHLDTPWGALHQVWLRTTHPRDLPPIPLTQARSLPSASASGYRHQPEQRSDICPITPFQVLVHPPTILQARGRRLRSPKFVSRIVLHSSSLFWTNWIAAFFEPILLHLRISRGLSSKNTGSLRMYPGRS